mgnify:CR=1 FL=1
MIVYDIVLHGEVKETIQAHNHRLKDLYEFMVEQLKRMKLKYGNQIVVKRRGVY